jgi:hypothetical protein
MGKVDDMRRQREALHGVTKPAGADADAAAADDGDADTGKCAVCGKLKALQNRLVAPHQKGLGTMCPGSRKPPA